MASAHADDEHQAGPGLVEQAFRQASYSMSVFDIEQRQRRLNDDERIGAGATGATCLYAVYDPVSRELAVAGAGHPPPVLVLPDGETQVVDVGVGPVLGVGGLPWTIWAEQALTRPFAPTLRRRPYRSWYAAAPAPPTTGPAGPPPGPAARSR